MAKHALLALQFRHRELKGHLRVCWGLVESWEEEVPTNSRLPLPQLPLQALAVLARTLAPQSFGLNSLKWFLLAVVLETGFYGLLRPGGLWQLTRGQVSQAAQQRVLPQW